MVFTYLQDVTSDMGPTRIVPGTHTHSLYDHYDEKGEWLGNIGVHDLDRLPIETAVSAVAPAGTVLLLNCATVHCAGPNETTRTRPMVINGYLSADTRCYVDISTIFPSRYSWNIVFGNPTNVVHHEEGRMKMPLDWRAHRGVRVDNLPKHRLK